MPATLMWTINDFPAYGMLSGWMTAGKLACPYCMEDTKLFTLKHGRKNSWFDCHRQFLPPHHEFRRKKYAFKKNKSERYGPPPILTGDDIWERVQNFPKVTEEPPYKFDRYGVAHNWTKQSIFWELPYWKDNFLRHNLDVMHIENNYFDNLTESANNKLLKPNTSYSFTMEQQRKICEWVESLKMPDGYASNLGKKVDIERGILHGMKSRDCHIFMEQLLPIAFCGLPENIWKPMTEISLFFKDLCSSTLRVENLVRMAKNIVVISNKLEKILPPRFFDVMEHLPIHLVHEALLGGPVQYRWMHPFERPNRHDATGNDRVVQSLSIFNQPEVQPFLDYFVSQYGHDQVLPSFITWYTNWDRPFTQEENKNLWKQSDGEPIRGSIYGYPEKAYQKKKSWYCGSSSSSFDGGDKETISAMESKIAYLNAELAVVAEREKKREEKERKREEEIAAANEVENKRYAALQAQLIFLFESGNILPPCPATSDENDKSDKESEGDENGKADKESESD
ncbi:hypothetical protein MTR67_017422 [Solanum verrucosum]|uniref:DUF4218 domain-containing protein n=1 Tax=Solanum verrucosum TaxID=315347 RepID=A0AAF0TKR8_SOLVR|nr:hypothetical protein MTR67_017422 [Solanum verrucosum]